jgi:hypothetical protein
MWVWLETFTPLLSGVLFAGAAWGLENDRFTGFLTTKFLT